MDRVFSQTNLARALFTVASLALGVVASAQVSMTPLASFGGGDGWLAPGEGGYAFLGTGNNERSISYGASTNHLYLVSRSGGINVRILDPLSGAEVGSLQTTGITGGTFALNMIRAASDGAIYGTNLKTGTASDDIYKVYKWDNESAAPTNTLTNTVLSGARLGDDLDLTGSAGGTLLVAGFAPGSTSPAGSNGYTVMPTGTSFTNVAFPVAPAVGGTAIGDFRLGITFTDADSVIGAQNSSVRATTFSGATGTLDGTLTLASAAERPMDFAFVGGLPLLATVESGSGATANFVHVYDMSNPLAPALLSNGRLTGATTTNGNAVGDVAWGLISGNSGILYAMNTNNGIQAFVVMVPEPSGGLLFGCGVVVALRRRRR